MGAVDLIIVIGFLLYAIGSGFRARKMASQSLEEYFLAGRSLPGWKAGISMAATQFAADTPLLVTGLIATAGLFSLWRLWIYALAFLLMGFVLAGSWRRVGVLTDAELTEIRYGARPAAVLRGFKAIYFGTIFNCTVLAIVLFAAKELAEPFLHWHEWLPAEVFAAFRDIVQSIGVPIAREVDGGLEIWTRSTNNILSIGAIVLVTTLYSATGGLRSVVQTDVLQFGLMIAGTALYAMVVVQHVGGLDALGERIGAMFAEGGPGGITPTQILAMTPGHAKDAALATLAVLLLQWLVQINADGTGYLAQRSMACRSEKDAKIAAVVFTFAQVFCRSLLWLPIGLGLLVLFPPDLSLPLSELTADREASFVVGMRELLPPGILGLMLTGMLAALASTVDTHLNWGASYWTNDIYKRFVCQQWLKRTPSERSLVWVARASNGFILLIALVIMTQLASIQVAWQASLLLGAGVGVVLVLRWVWWRMTAWGELTAVATSFVFAPILLLGLPEPHHEALRLLLMAVIATGAGIGASLVLGPERPETLQRFYARAQPPGFWGPVASALGEDAGTPVRRLGRGLLAMAIAAVSVFCLLTGTATWLVGSPAPVWFPWRQVWIGGLWAVGLGLLPVWWKLGFGQAVRGRQHGTSAFAVIDSAADHAEADTEVELVRRAL